MLVSKLHEPVMRSAWPVHAKMLPPR